MTSSGFVNLIVFDLITGKHVYIQLRLNQCFLFDIQAYQLLEYNDKIADVMYDVMLLHCYVTPLNVYKKTILQDRCQFNRKNKLCFNKFLWERYTQVYVYY